MSTKKGYYQPQMAQVKLKPEEKVLNSCKTDGHDQGPGGYGNCVIHYMPSLIRCLEEGS